MNDEPARRLAVDDVVLNLTALAESFNSVSDFCTKVGVNRQQFNKYLAGKHVPSQKVLSTIAKYFHMEAGDLLRPAAEFKALYEGLEQDLPDLRDSPGFAAFLRAAMTAGNALKRYHGFYQRYHCSALFKGQVLRSATSIFERDGLTQYVTVERFPMSNDMGGTSFFTFAFRGFCVLLGDRLFLVDFEDKLENELTFTVLTPPHRTPDRFMYGVLTGVASTSFRQPFSTRIALVRDGISRITRRDLRKCGVLDSTSPDIPVEIRNYLQSAEPPLIFGGAG